MAKPKRRTLKKRKKGTAAGEAIAFSPKVVGLRDVEPIYSNFARVRISPTEIMVDFCQITPAEKSELPELRKKGYIDALAKAVIMLPPDVAARLANLLKDMVERRDEIAAGLSE